jgi:hypothetical protein
MQIESSQGGHSADVRIRLLFNGTITPVAQLGPDFLILDDPQEHPPCDATLEMRIDESERRWPIRLPEGISTKSDRVVIANP